MDGLIHSLHGPSLVAHLLLYYYENLTNTS
jgi:hypothetical protein